MEERGEEVGGERRWGERGRRVGGRGAQRRKTVKEVVSY